MLTGQVPGDDLSWLTRSSRYFTWRRCFGARVSMYRFLGAFRVLLAAMVVVFHLGSLLPDAQRQALMHLEIGTNAVLVFFAISGYVIASAYANFYQGRPWAFIANRFLRLYPTYIIALLIFILVVHLSDGIVDIKNPETLVPYAASLSPGNVLANVILILPFSNAFTGVDAHAFLSIAWAVRVEFLFYFIFFGLCLAAHYLRWPPERALALAFGPFVLLFVCQQLAAQPTQFQFIPYFAFGVAVQILEARLIESERRAGSGKPAPGTYGARFFGPAAASLLCLALISWNHLSRARFHETGYERYLVLQYLLLLVLLAAFVALIWLSNTHKRQLTRFASLDKSLGDLSYPLYLNHAIVVLTLMAVVGPSMLASIGGGVASIAFAMVVAALTEPHIARLRERIRGRSISDRAISWENPARVSSPVVVDALRGPR